MEEVAHKLGVKVFPGRYRPEALEALIHSWLRANSVVVLDIQYRYQVYNNSGWYSAMVVYRMT